MEGTQVGNRFVEDLTSKTGGLICSRFGQDGRAMDVLREPLTESDRKKSARTFDAGEGKENNLRRGRRAMYLLNKP